MAVAKYALSQEVAPAPSMKGNGLFLFFFNVFGQISLVGADCHQCRPPIPVCYKTLYQRRLSAYLC